MARTRERGSKYPTNFVKIAIVLFIGDHSKSTSEILDYLRTVHGVSEPRGVRAHLSKLIENDILTKVAKKGLESYYSWNKTLDAFKQILKLIYDNIDLVKIIQNKNGKKRETYHQITQFHQDTLTTPVRKQYDPAHLWYSTNYALS